MMASPSAVPWIDESEVESLLDVASAIPALEEAFAMVPSGQAMIMPRAHVTWDDGALHVVAAAVPGQGIAGVKTWVRAAGGARPVVIMFSAEDGSVLGMVDALSLGRLRTGATSAIGTRLLARPQAQTMAIIGTGGQALAQVAGAAAVRRLAEVRVFSRDERRKRDFARRVEDELGLAAVPSESVAAAVRGAEIVTTVTRSRTPVLHASHLEPGMHINSVGAIVASSVELDTAAVGRCALIAVESLEQARSDAGDLRKAVREGALRWEDVSELGTLVAGGAERTSDADITLLRTLGVGLADVAVAAVVLRRHETKHAL